MMKVVGIFVHLKIQSMLIIIKQNDTRFGTTHSVYQFWMIKKKAGRTPNAHSVHKPITIFPKLKF